MCLPLQITAVATNQEQPSHEHGAQGQMAPQCPSQQPHPTIITPSELKGFFSITSADNASLLLPGGGTQIQGCLQSFLHLFLSFFVSACQGFQKKEASEAMKETAAWFASLASQEPHGQHEAAGQTVHTLCVQNCPKRHDVHNGLFLF